MISIFCDGMVYSSHGGYLLQENGRQIDSKIEKVDVTNHSLSFPNKKTPIYSNGYILWFLDPYMKGEYEGCQDILLIPPINSYSIRQRLLDECSNNEFLLHFDDNYIIRSEYFQNWSDKSINKGWNELKVYKSNGSLVQSVCIPTHNQNYKSIFSQSGEYIIVPCELLPIQEEQDHFDQNRSNYPDYIPSTPNSKVFYIYKISKCDNSNQHNMEESKIDENLND